MDEKEFKDIFPVDISEEMKNSYLQYAMSVIVGRALPDVRDGLKPVHRRVLYAMKDLGNTFDKPYKKSARVVGDVIGKYHPHGEAAVYDTIVRMAQDFSINHILVDGQGNFGSIDGDTAAASRYTEIRMTSIAGELLTDIEKDTCDFEWNYDDSLLIPTVLPSQFPNLLINGSEGIAVGMASKIPPHNLEEVVEACLSLLEDKFLSDEEILKTIPAPDFPTAGVILGRAGVIQAYKTGKGSVCMRAVAEIEEKNGKEQIIVSELPYQVNKAHLIESIATLVQDKKIEGISDIRDESSREGMRIVIVLKRKENAQVVLNNLYKQTRLQINFGIHLLALDKNGQPQTFSMKNILHAFLDHRRDVITRRLVFDLNKALERVHILEGLTKALDHLDRVISLIRESKEVFHAKQGLMQEFSLTALQAQSILDLKLQKLTGMERQKIVDECEELKRYIKETREILSQPKEIDNIVKKELTRIKEKYSQPRKTRIEDVEDDFTDKDLIPIEDIVIHITSQSKVKRIPLEEYRLQKRGGVGLKGASLGPEGDDWVWKTLCVTTHTILLVVSNKGKLFHLDAYKIPSGTRTSKRRSIRNLLPFESDEVVRSIVHVEDFSDENKHLCMVSEEGLFKKNKLSLFSRRRTKGLNAFQTKKGDKLVGAVLTTPGKSILIVSQLGMGVLFDVDEVRTIKGRQGFGVKGMTLKKEDRVIGVHSIDFESRPYLFTVSQNGYGKISDVSSIRRIKRGGKGVFVHKLTQRTGPLAAALSVELSSQIFLVTNKGQTIRFSCEELSQKGRHSQGVRLIRLKEGEFVTGISKIISMDYTVEQNLDKIIGDNTGITQISKDSDQNSEDGSDIS